jgi:hypothetical protein
MTSGRRLIRASGGGLACLFAVAAMAVVSGCDDGATSSSLVPRADHRARRRHFTRYIAERSHRHDRGR